MAVGIISYQSCRGLGNMAHDLRKQLGITRQLVVPDAGWPSIAEWANGEEFYAHGIEIQRDELVAWQQTDNVDTVVAIETGFGDNTFKWCKELGMTTILIVMWEHFNPYLPAYKNVDLYLCPSFRCYQEVPFDNKIFLPWPVDTDEFSFSERTGPAKVFVHNAGSGGMNGRKGTLETIVGFIKSEVYATLLLRSQVPITDIVPEFDGLLAQAGSRIKVDYGAKPTRAELYTDGDVLIYPSKYDGHSLVAIEGMAAGMPVITTDADPMNEYWRSGYPLLVKIQERKFAGTVNPHCLQMIVDTDDLAEKIWACATTSMDGFSKLNRAIAEKDHSWNVLRDRWKRNLGIEA